MTNYVQKYERWLMLEHDRNRRRLRKYLNNGLILKCVSAANIRQMLTLNLAEHVERDAF